MTRAFEAMSRYVGQSDSLFHSAPLCAYDGRAAVSIAVMATLCGGPIGCKQHKFLL